MVRHLVLVSMLLIGCGGTSAGPDDEEDSRDGGMTSAPLCLQRCADRAVSCGAPSPTAAAEVCTNACSSNPGDSQLSCLETSPCQALQAAVAMKGSICGLDFGARSDAGTAPDSGSASDAQPSGGCTIGDRRCDGDFTAIRCEELAGRPVTVTEDCAMPIPGTTSGSFCGSPYDGYCYAPEHHCADVGSTCDANQSDYACCVPPLACENGACCQIEGERCSGTADCCGGMSCVDAPGLSWKICAF